MISNTIYRGYPHYPPWNVFKTDGDVENCNKELRNRGALLLKGFLEIGVHVAGKLGRNSGIESLKIIAIFLIVISHVVQTLRSEKIYISYSDYVVDVSIATTNVQTFILALFSYFGEWGNTIFFVCSAWFLLRSSKYNKRKWFFMLFEIWVVSIIILVVTFFIRHGDVSSKLIIRSILPTTFSNNWYLTCYLLFYPIHPYLNSIIQRSDKRHLFRISGALF